MIDSSNNEVINCEFLIIGSGAGGSVASKFLADQGKDVLLIEEGKEYETNSKNNLFSNSFLNAWRNSGVTPIISKSNFAFGEGMCLGGGTSVNGGLVWRTPEIILKKWNTEFNIKKFSSDNLLKYFEEIENNLGLDTPQSTNIEDNKESLKLLEISKKKLLKIVKIPKSINSSKIDNKLIIGQSSNSTNTILQKNINSSKKKGLRIITKCKAQKLVSENGRIKSVKVIIDKNKKTIIAKNIILACGATQTPMLLKKSFGNNYFQSEIQCHLNFRIGVKFKNFMQDQNETMFSRQIQEYLEDGILIMPTSFNKSNFFSSLAKMNNNELSLIEKEINNFSSFIIQLQSLSKIKLNNYFNQTILSYEIDASDLIKLKKYFFIFCSLLFEFGAEKIFLPFKKNFEINKKDDLKYFLEKNLVSKNLEMVSVHGMSSAKMGLKKEKNIIFDLKGRSFDFENLFCLDSSILPSSTIESPQGTIMAVASQILEENFN